MRPYYQLTSEERYALSALRKQDYSIRGIARALERAPSTISREIRRNRRKDGGYPGPHGRRASSGSPLPLPPQPSHRRRRLGPGCGLSPGELEPDEHTTEATTAAADWPLSVPSPNDLQAQTTAAASVASKATP
jgi:IS30 family transposase